MKLTIGICTYNRKNIIEYTSKSLKEINNIECANVKIYDDSSVEYDINYLKKLYPMAKKINRTQENLGADYNTQKMYEDFLKSEDEYLFNADSDLIFNKDILTIIEKNINILKKANKPVVFSVFNTSKHKTIKDFDENLCIKHSVGAAGVVFSKEVIKMFVNKIPQKYSVQIPSIDHCFCDILRKNKYDIFCTKKSYVQHIGLIGQNSSGINVDWGKDFTSDTLTNANAIIEVLQGYLINDIPANICNLCEQGKVGSKTIVKALGLCVKFKIKNFCEKLKGKK